MSAEQTTSPSRALALAAARAAREEAIIERYGSAFLAAITEKPLSYGEWQQAVKAAGIKLKSSEQVGEAQRWRECML